MSILNAFYLLGGLALFLFGMSVMADGLEKYAGSKLNDVLKMLTDNKYKAFLLGVVVTAIIQSSSATTVMVVGFVNSGIMQLSQTVGIIMGANVGTAVTAWLLSLTVLDGDSLLIQLLKPSSFSPVLAFIGIILYMFLKGGKKKELGTIFIGFAVLMYGMEAMSDAVKPLADVPQFANLLLVFSNPLLGILMGALITAIIQSSSASVGILQALSVTGSVTYATAIPIILGQNIGTCITALISSVGTNTNAKRAAFVHLYFNLIGTIIFLFLYYSLDMIFQFAFVGNQANALGIAVVHTVFKLVSTVILMPFCDSLVKLAVMTVKEKPEDGEGVPLLDERLLVTPTVAINQCRILTAEMGTIARDNLFQSIENLETGYDQETADLILEREDRIDLYEDKLSSFMIQLSQRSLTENDSREISKLLHSIGEFERIGDHAVNVLGISKEMHDREVAFSEKATAELEVITEAVKEIVNLAMEAFLTGNIEIADRVEPLEQVVDILRSTLKNRHIKRLREGRCTIELGFNFLELLTNYERVADHCSNIAVCVIELHHGTFDTHEYLQKIKSEPDTVYANQFKEYRNKYTGLLDEKTKDSSGQYQMKINMLT